MKKLNWVLLAAAVGMLSFGCKKEEPVAETKPAEQPKAAAPAEVKPETPAPSQPAPPPSEPAAAPRAGFDRTLLRPAMLAEKAPDTYQVKFSTTRGDFIVTVTRAWAPLGADRFYNLVKHHFYENASFFRVIPNFMAQFGISAYPPVSSAWEKATIKDDPVTQSNKRGYVTFATGGPNTRTTQVFINFKDNSRLDRDGFAPFGKVDDQGMKVVDMLYDVYGEGAPDGNGPEQGKINVLGKPYLDKSFPKLDSIKTATLVGAGGAAPK